MQPTSNECFAMHQLTVTKRGFGSKATDLRCPLDGLFASESDLIAAPLKPFVSQFSSAVQDGIVVCMKF